MSVGLGNQHGLPGISAKRESAERQVWTGRWEDQIVDPFPKIGGAAVDAGSSPTTALRAGLVMAKKDSDSLWYEYDPTATDGREQAQGVLYHGLSMLGPDGAAEDKSGNILVGGYLKASQLVGLDSLARQQLSARFIFDDDFAGRGWLGPHLREIEKTASYTVVAADNMSCIVQSGSSGAVTFTLPAIGKGYRFVFRNQDDQNMIVASAEGDNMVTTNDAAADSVAFQTSSQKIGGAVLIYSNEQGDKWIVENRSAGANTITAAT